MLIVTGSQIYQKKLSASVVTIGNFDGVHRGHCEIFVQLRKRSRDLKMPSVVVTFEPHPLKVLSPESAPSLLTTYEQKIALIEENGVDYLVVVPFSKEFSQVSADDFVVSILCNSLTMRHIIIGHDYAFGKGRAGNFHTLQKLGNEHGFSVEDLPPISDEMIVFSSSLARTAVTEGNMAAAAHILGRFYQISGKVVHGRDIGSSIGFPTANIASYNELLPLDGVYAVIAQVDGLLLQGACNIGCNPTFDGTARTVEVFLFDYSGNLYDHEITLQFVQRVRAVCKFPDVSALQKTISRDVEECRIILISHGIKLPESKPGLEQCED